MSDELKELLRTFPNWDSFLAKFGSQGLAVVLSKYVLAVEDTKRKLERIVRRKKVG